MTNRASGTLNKLQVGAFTSLIFLSFALVTPWHNLEATNPAKFMVVMIIGASLIGFSVISEAKGQNNRLTRNLGFIVGGIIAWLLIALISNSKNIDERIFGIYGRNLGFLTFFVLTLIIAITAKTKFKNLNWLVHSSSASLLVIALYFIIQDTNIARGNW